MKKTKKVVEMTQDEVQGLIDSHIVLVEALKNAKQGTNVPPPPIREDAMNMSNIIVRHRSPHYEGES